MKIISFILSIIIFAMALMPCVDIIADFHASDSYSISIPVDSHNHPHSGKDDCSPFCVCQCCGNFLSIGETPLLNARKVKIYFAYSAPYSFNYYHDYLGEIWRPPTHS